MGLLRRFRRRHRQQPPQPYLQGEEYEIVKAEREAQRERERFADSLIEKAGHVNYPFSRDPFE
jgi:hypothetical protein